MTLITNQSKRLLPDIQCNLFVHVPIVAIDIVVICLRDKFLTRPHDAGVHLDLVFWYTLSMAPHWDFLLYIFISIG